MKIKKGDKVVVLAGKDKGKTGNVQRVMPKKEQAIVEGVNLLKRHTKPSQKHPKGGVITFPAPIHLSNLMVVCPKCDKPTRVSYRFKKVKGEKRKERVCRRCGASLDLSAEKK